MILLHIDNQLKVHLFLVDKYLSKTNIPFQSLSNFPLIL